MDPLRPVPNARKLALAREFRSSPTPGERFAWSLLRRHQIHGLRFRRQHVLHGFIVDFYCAKLRLVIEIDGDSHDDVASREYDIARAAWLENAGYTIIRIRNKDVTRERLTKLIGRVLKVRTRGSFPRSRRERGSGGEE